MKIGEFFVQLGVKAESATLRDFAGAIADLPLKTAGAIAALAGLQYELVKIAGEAMEAAVGFQMFQAQTGLSWKELQKWQIVAQQANVSAEALGSSVMALQRQLAEIRLGRGNIAPFQMLGISANQNAFAVLEQLRQRIKGLDEATSVNIISQMGLTPEMISVLNLSDAKFKQFTQTVKGMNSAQEETFLKAKLSLVQLGLQAKYFGFEFVGHLIDGFSILATKVKELHVNLKMLAAVGIAVAYAFSPLTTILVALLLVLEDLAVYFAGGESLTGDAIKGIKELAKEFKSIFDFNNIPNAPWLMKLADKLMMVQPGGQSPSQIVNAAINVYGNTDPEETAKAVKKHIDRLTNAASLQTNNGGQ